MQSFSEDESRELFPLSWLSQYGYCKRRCSLLALEQIWQENEYTAAGRMQHKRVHTGRTEQRGDSIYIFEMPVFSHALGVSGFCDCVEAHPSPSGVAIPHGKGKYTFYPVEYKHGVVRDEEEYHLQLCAQAICLEERFGVEIPAGAISLTPTDVMRYCFHRNCGNRHGKRQRKYQIWWKARRRFRRLTAQSARSVPCGRPASRESDVPLSRTVKVFGRKR